MLNDDHSPGTIFLCVQCLQTLMLRLGARVCPNISQHTESLSTADQVCKTSAVADYHVLLHVQGCGRLLAGSRSLPNSVLQESDTAREAPAPHRAAGSGPPPPVCLEQPHLPGHVLLLPFQPPADTGTLRLQPRGLCLLLVTYTLRLVSWSLACSPILA